MQIWTQLRSAVIILHIYYCKWLYPARWKYKQANKSFSCTFFSVKYFVDKDSFTANYTPTKKKTCSLIFFFMKERKKERTKEKERKKTEPSWSVWWITNSSVDSSKHIFRFIWIFHTCYLNTSLYSTKTCLRTLQIITFLAI